MDYEEEDYKNAKFDAKPWRKIIEVMLRHPGILVGLLVSVVLVALGDIASTLLNQHVINIYFESDSANRFNSLPWIIAIYSALAIYFGVMTYVFISFATKIEATTAYEIRKDAYKKLQELPFSYYDTTQQGWIMARMTSDSRNLSEILSWGMFDFLWGGLNMIGYLIILMIANIQLSIIILILGVILFVLTLYFRKVMLKNYREVRKINSVITASYNEGFMGSNTSKSLVIENKNKERFHGQATTYRRRAISAAIFSSLFGPTIFFIGYVGIAATLYFGGLKVLGQTLLVSQLFLFVQSTIKFFDPVLTIATFIGNFQQAQASAERVVALIEEDVDIVDSPEVIEKYGTLFEPKPENYEPLEGDIEFKNVSFKYKVGGMILEDFNLHVKKGQTIGLVGHTGSGKSTIVNLVCRFYEPVSGKILFDGRDYRERSVSWLHSKIGYVLQSPQLFSGSIKENVRYGKLDATDEEIIEACKIVHAHEFIMELDKGYDTVIGEGGSRLSQGQRQLISFARALIKNPSLLILDEATSSIDTKTESLIQHAIDEVSKNRTTFTVAHRLSTIVNADLIICLEKGQIIESGTHEELLAKKGYYYTLYKNQFADENTNDLLSNS